MLRGAGGKEVRKIRGPAESFQLRLPAPQGKLLHKMGSSNATVPKIWNKMIWVKADNIRTGYKFISTCNREKN